MARPTSNDLNVMMNLFLIRVTVTVQQDGGGPGSLTGLRRERQRAAIRVVIRPRAGRLRVACGPSAADGY